MVRAIVAGAAGRMGSTIIRNILRTEGIELAAAFERPESPAVGKDVAEVLGLSERTGVVVEDSLEKVIERGEVIIDFTFHEASLAHARLNARYGKAMVIGTTGFSKEELSEIHDLARKHFPLVQAYNMSLGINLLYKLVELATRVLGEDFDIEIVEAHHRMKKDAPSGTAVKLSQILRETADLKRIVHCREGESPRQEGDLGVFAVRGGDVVGDHTVYFLGFGERIELTHRASSRDTFAKGAVEAAKWIRGKDPGMYSMFDILDL